MYIQTNMYLYMRCLHLLTVPTGTLGDGWDSHARTPTHLLPSPHVPTKHKQASTHPHARTRTRTHTHRDRDRHTNTRMQQGMFCSENSRNDACYCMQARDCPVLCQCMRKELRYDYGMSPEAVQSADGAARHQPCLCGSSVCRGLIY